MSIRPPTGALLVALLAVASPPALARTSSHGPTAAQIRADVRRAERSGQMWATVNICNTPRHHHIIGIRGQIPSLGFTTELDMDFQIDYWSYARRRFQIDPGVRKFVALGLATHALQQEGVTFPFDPPVVLSGTVTFEWKRAGKLLGRVTRKTGHGYKHVDFADPPGYSAATCTIK